MCGALLGGGLRERVQLKRGKLPDLIKSTFSPSMNCTSALQVEIFFYIIALCVRVSASGQRSMSVKQAEEMQLSTFCQLIIGQTEKRLGGN